MRWAQYAPIPTVIRSRRKQRKFAAKYPGVAGESLEALEDWSRVYVALCITMCLLGIPFLALTLAVQLFEAMASSAEILGRLVGAPCRALHECSVETTEAYFAIKRRVEPKSGFVSMGSAVAVSRGEQP